jgi:hypothetical protein
MKAERFTAEYAGDFALELAVLVARIGNVTAAHFFLNAAEALKPCRHDLAQLQRERGDG